MSRRIKIRVQDEYPEGHVTLYRWFDVAGVHFRRDDILKFAGWKAQFVSMCPDPSNAHDKNAIMVLGHGTAGWLFRSEKRAHIGYLPRELSAELAEKNLVGVAAIHLNQIDVGGEYTHVKVSLSIPAEPKPPKPAKKQKPGKTKGTL